MEDANGVNTPADNHVQLKSIKRKYETGSAV